MALTGPDLALVLALHARDRIGARTLSRWLRWASAQGAPLHSFTGRPRQELLAVLPAGLDRLVAALAEIRDEELNRAERLAERVERAGAQFYAITDADYPAALLAALDTAAPPLLAIAGDAELFARPAGGVVGSRTPSEAGATLAGNCARWLAGHRRVVVSGGAQGIDTAAHAAALEAGGATIVVLPQGLLSYGASRTLAGAIEEGRVALVSQFLPDGPWSVGAAVARNETIAALSRVVCVVEPGSAGGSAKTGQDALNQRKPVLVYAGVDARQTGRALGQAGARQLLGPEGRLSEEYLEEVWREAAARDAKLQKLL